MKKDKLEGKLIISEELYRDVLCLGTPYGRVSSSYTAANAILDQYRKQQFNSSYMKYIEENHDVISELADGVIPVFKVAEVYREAGTNEIIVVEVTT